MKQLIKKLNKTFYLIFLVLRTFLKSSQKFSKSSLKVLRTFTKVLKSSQKFLKVL